MDVGEGHQTLVAGGGGGDGGLGEHAADRVHDSSGQGVAMGVNADDAVDLVGQHGHRTAPFKG
jgi:hypothetical protein